MIGKKIRVKKVRLDQLLIDRGLVKTQHQAEALILSRQLDFGFRNSDCGVKSSIRNHQSAIDFRPGTMVSPDLEISIIEPVNPYVSRGGLKLAGALVAFKINLKNKIAIDIGASTGGFTDCMLQNGIKKVYAIDTGYGHFASKLRADPRVVLLEKVNARYLTLEKLNPQSEITNPQLDIAVIDVSFISLTKIIPAVIPLLKDGESHRQGGEIVALIKPQFEIPKSAIKNPQSVKRGVVRDPALREAAVQLIVEFAIKSGLQVIGTVPAVITGPAGNQEYFIYLKKDYND